jgi:predicted dehydrogenase
MNRREFLGQSLLAAGAAVVPGIVPDPARLSVVAPAPERPKAGPNDRLRIATVGVRGQGGAHVRLWAAMKDVEVGAICDVDEGVIAEAMKRAEETSGKKPTYYQDFRKLLDDKSIDAISIATCNHTHTLIALSAVQAGKDVYVEKPLSHTLWEGRKILEAARKYDRLVQHGTQSRSDGRRKQAVQYMAAGKLGKVKVARGLCYKRRDSIGKKPDGPVPSGVDYDLWLGPAPERSFNPNRFHYNWHWNWDYGNGDIGNQGIHEMDVARWGLGKPGLPRKIISIGGRFGYEDDGLTPNTQIALFDYGDSVLIFEVRGLLTEEYRGALIGNVFHGEKGIIVAGGKGVTALDPRGEEITKFSWEGNVDHFRNFVDCVKSRKREALSADVAEGHLSCSLVHLANISYRLGEGRPMAKDDPFGSYEDGNEAFRRLRDHLREHEIPIDKAMLQVGRALEFDPTAETFVGDAEANQLLRREYRKPFVVPDKV